MSADVKTYIALVGPPNAGKTALFHLLTGVGSRPVNYPGATVEYTVGTVRKHLGTLRVADTPGTYSLLPKSPEEKVTLDVLFGANATRPEGVVVVVDSTQLSRHLPLARQVLESGYPVVVAITMSDLVQRDKRSLDVAALSRWLGAPVVSVNGLTGEGISELAKALASLKPPSATPHPPAVWSANRQEQELKWAAEIAGKVLTTEGVRTGLSTAEKTRQLDRVLLHPVAGLAIFAAIMGALFTSIFWLAAPAMDAVTGVFESGANALLNLAPGRLWSDFVAGGVILSVGAVLTFVPQIFILFLGITLLEDSGYLARAATLIDRPLSRLGLNGRSFVPLLSGYACAIPAMLAARTIPNRKERWLTLFIIPLMSCSARLPVYSLMLAFLFWDSAAWKPGLVLAGLYMGSLVIGSAAAAMLSRLLPTEETSFFLMELPLYRRPSWRNVLKTAFLRTESYVIKAGPAIFVFATILWAATTFPHYEMTDASQKIQNSYAARVGKYITPVMEPMGGDWRTGVALLSAFAAREVFVSSLGLVLQVSEQDEEKREVSILAAMRAAKHEDGTPLFTPASVTGLLLFFLIALQCMSTLAVARREYGGWKYPLIQLVSFNVIAYALAVAAVQGLRHFGVT